jgi:hypothetical protein
LERDEPTLALQGINGDSAGNYQLMEEEVTKGMVNPPGITISETRNTPKKENSGIVNS